MTARMNIAEKLCAEAGIPLPPGEALMAQRRLVEFVQFFADAEKWRHDLGEADRPITPFPTNRTAYEIEEE